MVAAGPDEPKRSTYIGLFLTTLSLLQFELFLTRIFSVTMWYHFAFMPISLAMCCSLWVPLINPSSSSIFSGSKAVGIRTTDSMKNGMHFRASTCENWEASRLDGD